MDECGLNMSGTSKLLYTPLQNLVSGIGRQNMQLPFRLAIKEIADRPEELQGVCQAKTGIICGGITIAIWIFVIIGLALG